jgi:hypothetical protein
VPDPEQPPSAPIDEQGRTLVRSTIEPHRELWVDESERLDLERSGLLVDSDKPRPEDAGAAPARRRATTKPDTGDTTKEE